MKKMKFLSLSLTMALCLGVGAYAASNNENISALLNREITITYKGEAQSFQDANGNTVYPITYNGTTYLPVRGVSNLVGLPVSWDQATNTVKLGTDEKQPVYLVKQPSGKPDSRAWIINDPEQLKFAGDSGIQEFKNGTTSTIWNGSSSSSNSLLYFDVAGYTQLSFTVAYDKPCTVKVYDQDGGIHSQFDFDGGIMTKTINLNGAKKIALSADGRINTPTSYGNHGSVFFYEPTLS